MVSGHSCRGVTNAKMAVHLLADAQLHRFLLVKSDSVWLEEVLCCSAGQCAKKAAKRHRKGFRIVGFGNLPKSDEVHDPTKLGSWEI